MFFSFILRILIFEILIPKVSVKSLRNPMGFFRVQIDALAFRRNHNF
jgi:hypothetical protein